MRNSWFLAAQYRIEYTNNDGPFPVPVNATDEPHLILHLNLFSKLLYSNNSTREPDWLHHRLDQAR